MVDRFSPGVVLEDGTTYEPKGWEWILGFALGGCEWAIGEASRPGFRAIIVEDLKKRKEDHLLEEVDKCLEKIKSFRKRIRNLST